MSDVSFGQLVRMVRGCLIFIDDKESDMQSAVVVA